MPFCRSGAGCSTGGSRRESRACWLGLRRTGAADHHGVLLRPGAVGTDRQPHRLRPLCARRHPQSALRRARQLSPAVARAAVLAGGSQHRLLRRGGGAAVPGGLARERAARQLAAGVLQRLLPHRVVRAGGDDPGGRGGRVALSAAYALWTHQLCARSRRHSPDRLAGRSALGVARYHPVRGVEELRLQHGHFHGRAAQHSRRPVRSGAPRRCEPLAGARPHHAADVASDPAAGEHPDGRGIFPAVRGAVCDDPGRAAAKHGQRAVPHVRRRLQVVESRFRLRGRVPALPHDPRGHGAAGAPRARRAGAMSVSGARVLLHALLLGAAAITLFPLLWMLSVSFMAGGEASAFPPPLLPGHGTLANYRQLFGQQNTGRYLTNSLSLAAMTTLLSLLLNSLAGYAFAKLRVRAREPLLRVLMAALVIPSQVAMLPLFLMMKWLGLVNTYAAVVVPAMAGIFGVFLVRQYALTIPDELLEAARIDGASELRIFTSIVLPALRPILVTLGVFTFLGSWNDFMWPLIVLTDQGLYTLPIALATLSREHVQDNELMMAGAVLTVLPVLALFLSLQRYYIRGILMGSVKG